MTDTFDISVVALSDIPPGEGRTFQAAGERIAVFHARTGQVFATQAECPHRGGPLADGLLGGAMLVCPLHSWKFDLATGETTDASCRLRTYPVRIEGGRIVLSVPAPVTPVARLS